MAQLAVIVMCRSERPPPDVTRSLAYSATKPSATQKSSSFGIITSTGFPNGDFGSARQLQLGLKLMF